MYGALLVTQKDLLIEIRDQIKELNTILAEAFIEQDEPQEEKIEFSQGVSPDSTRNFLDNNIRHWRKEKIDGNPRAKYYIDAYQSVRISLFGKRLDMEFRN